MEIVDGVTAAINCSLDLSITFTSANVLGTLGGCWTSSSAKRKFTDSVAACYRFLLTSFLIHHYRFQGCPSADGSSPNVCNSRVSVGRRKFSERSSSGSGLVRYCYSTQCYCYWSLYVYGSAPLLHYPGRPRCSDIPCWMRRLSPGRSMLGHPMLDAPFAGNPMLGHPYLI